MLGGTLALARTAADICSVNFFRDPKSPNRFLTRLRPRDDDESIAPLLQSPILLAYFPVLEALSEIIHIAPEIPCVGARILSATALKDPHCELEYASFHCRPVPVSKV